MYVAATLIGDLWNAGINLNNTSTARIRRLLTGDAQLSVERRYTTLKDEVKEISKEDDSHLVKKLNEPIYDDPFRKQVNSVPNDENIHKTYNLVSSNNNFGKQHDAVKYSHFGNPFNTLKNDVPFDKGLDVLKHENHYNNKFETKKRGRHFGIPIETEKRGSHLGIPIETEKRGGHFDISYKTVKRADHFDRPFKTIKRYDHFGKPRGTLKHSGHFDTKPSVFNHYKNDNYLETLDSAEYDKAAKMRHKKKNKTILHALKYNGKVEEQNKLGILKFLNKLDSKFELEMKRALEPNSGSTYSHFKHKSMRRKLSYYMDKYKVFLPILINFLIVIVLLTSKATIAAGVFIDIGFLVSLYYYIKYKKLKMISTFFTMFNQINQHENNLSF
ncbi:Pv-fam-d protein [Plasmodium ovale wallikeri]|uniref:Pv-fam-d protein n=1 Tax=Plasmodium ovale wallikeri TaxID=864142 RepID=A0A1A8YQ69_PLAOA|nr:Pv-fam-d protein [Plasmodium ovale wallikeri]SBT33571.1 Pv-fam-d protein [Plasmodium ovale wallikeri]